MEFSTAVVTLEITCSHCSFSIRLFLHRPAHRIIFVDPFQSKCRMANQDSKKGIRVQGNQVSHWAQHG